ncbi:MULTISPECIES: membrane protein insertion efficiency factor YidD [Marinobacter]|uniref:Putative membrane protein insertion efficiency factor n=1 Tax=Marinobacter xestospongiae TaxID=994319 RepID=A0ABU3VZC8_9GAMM|nr:MULTISPECIES: membrane protein insertion efficiency factor YidD [Marinobacter]MCG8520238.1 membrane protein insertion efficiency factor YidD [Pseudomonadales bacterium]MDV2079639.1 membrane protein insertion efficiency factor YidD [Marinobacter xestospongiae]UDL05035.1 membrane protein insertion efficiency factor YidD [Marinobacter sp. CA1]
MRKLLLLPIRCYQYAISPMMASHCRHYPTCSNYAIEAIERHGAVRGSYLAGRRLLRCHPWSPGGYDPVPPSTPTPPSPEGSSIRSANANQTTQ